MTDHTDLKIAIAILLSSFLAGIAIVTFINDDDDASAEPDCEQVGVHDNPSGNAAGNGHECIGGSGDNPEPVRDCDHKNSEKDNNNDGTTACIPRGGSVEDALYIPADQFGEEVQPASTMNCDSANLGANDQGHIRGNSKCSTGIEPEEPARDCGHKNSEKDNDGDTATICINRG